MPERKEKSFNVLLGPNNIGKTTAAETIASKHGFEYIKYPLYKLEPHGPIIDEVVHKGRKMDADELQLHYAQNRRDYEPYLNKILESGKRTIVEDYTLTGVIWGLVEGLSLYNLFEINQGLKKPDRYILMDGERFKTGREKGHRFEDTDEDDLKWQKARDIFLSFARAYEWPIVNANQAKEKVVADILEILHS